MKVRGLTVEEKETIEITGKGRKIVKEIRREPQQHALRKALGWLAWHIKVSAGPLTFEGK